jgi:hypothetical protein
MRPHADVLLRNRNVHFFVDYGTVPAGAWVVDERAHDGATSYVRERRATWKVLRRRNYEAAVFRK